MPKITVLDIAGDAPIGSFEIELEGTSCTVAGLIRAKVEAEHRKVTEAFSAQSGMMAKLAEALSGELEPMVAQSISAFENRAFTMEVDGIEVTSSDQLVQIQDGAQATFRRPESEATPVD